MKKEDIPQDYGTLSKATKEMCYAVDESGNYVTGLSTGWEVKATALSVAWKDIEARVKDAKAKVLNNQASPILYFMELRLMDVAIVAAYTGFWKFQINNHLKPGVFKKMSEKKLKKYAEAFNVTVEDLKTMHVNEE